jgi:hypothetical protein
MLQRAELKVLLKRVESRIKKPVKAGYGKR